MGGKAGGSGSKLSSSTGNKSSNFGSTASKSSNFGSSASKTNNFGSSASKTSNFGSAGSKMSNFSPTASKSNFGSTPTKSTFGAVSHGKDNSSSRTPSFFGGESAKVSTGHTPSTSKKAYDTLSYTNPKVEKSRTFGIIWLPGRKRSKKKEQAFSSINYDKKNERTPKMYNVMSGDSDFQVHKRNEESALLVPEKLKGPIATVASAGTASVIAELPPISPASDLEEKLLHHDNEESKEAAGDATNKEDTDYLENKVSESKPEKVSSKTSDKVDSVFVSPPVPMKPPPEQSVTSNSNEDDCIITCLYYTLQCCDCVLM